MTPIDTHQESIDAIVRRISDLNEQSLTQLSQYISYLKWQEELWHSLLDDDSGRQDGDDADLSPLVWQYDFVENFAAARQAATRTTDLMEIKVGLATCGMVQQSALWQHPPVIGTGVCEYEVTVPAEVERLRLRFGVGIRDGALMEGENLCAFRIIVNGARVWSTTKQSNTWERFQIDLPTLSGQKLIIQFMTDSLGDARWNWAVWAEPQLLGYGG